MNIRSSNKNLCMIEPRLINFTGHAFNYALSLKREVEELGGEFCILVSKDCDKEIILELNGIPVFDKNPSNNLFKSIWKRFVIVPIIFNYHLFCGLSRFRKTTSTKWNYFMGTTQYFDLFAIFLFNLSHKVSEKLFLTARMTNYRIDLNRWSVSTFWYRLFFSFLFYQNKIKNNIFIITDSENLQSEYQKITRFPINLLPIPHTFQIASNKYDSVKETSEIVVVSLGPARIQKGFTQIEKLVQKCCTSKNEFKSKVSFHLQCSAIQDSETKESLDKLKSQNYENVFLYENELSEAEYFNLLAKSHIVLLPYNKVSYYAQTSGVFTESIAMKKIVLVNRPTWMSQQLDKFNIDTSCNTDDEKEFYVFFNNICNYFTHYQKLMEEMSVKWNQFHNQKNFINTLFKLEEK